MTQTLPHLPTTTEPLPLVARLRQTATLNRAADMLALAGLRRRTNAVGHALGVLLALQRVGETRNQQLAQWLDTETQVMDTPADFLVVAARAATICTDLGIPYLIGGGVASTVHGEFRTTRDIDIVLLLSKHTDAQRLAKELVTEFTLHPPDITAAFQQTLDAAQDRTKRGSFSAYDRATGYRLDIHISRPTVFDRSQFDRALPIIVPEVGALLMIASAEDTILTKLEWYAITPSDRQWEDVQTILRVQQDSLDTRYLDHWASQLGVAPLWHRAQQAMLPPHHQSAQEMHQPTDQQQLKLDLGE
jgi:hypothetical protein